MSASRSPSSSPTTATSPKTPPRCSRSTTSRCRRFRDCRAALERGAPTAHRNAPHNLVAEFDMAYGNVEAAFAGAAHVFRESLWQHRGGSHSIECRGVVAAHDPIEDRLTLYSSTQTPHVAMRLLCDLLGRDENRVRVIAPDVGGGFGPKLVFYQEEIVRGARRDLARPAGEMDRGSARAFRLHDAGARSILGRRDRGRCRRAHPRRARHADPRPWRLHGARRQCAVWLGAALPLAYEVPAYRLDIKLALTNKVPVTPVRGAGQPQGVFAIERLLDRVARDLSSIAPRCAGAISFRPTRCRCKTPLKTRGGMQVVLDSGDYPACQQAALGARRLGRFSRAPAGRRDARAAISASASPILSKAPAADRSSRSRCASRRRARFTSIPAPCNGAEHQDHAGAGRRRTCSAATWRTSPSPPATARRLRSALAASIRARRCWPARRRIAPALKVRDKALIVASHLLEAAAQRPRDRGR